GGRGTGRRARRGTASRASAASRHRWRLRGEAAPVRFRRRMTWRARFRKSLVYLVAIVAGFSLAYLLVAFVIFPAGVIPRDVKVPNVMGLGFDEAAARLAQAGFKTEQGEQRYNNTAPKMTVLEQSPPPGAREGIGASVTLVVSGGQRLVGVPTVA